MGTSQNLWVTTGGTVMLCKCQLRAGDAEHGRQQKLDKLGDKRPKDCSGHVTYQLYNT